MEYEKWTKTTYLFWAALLVVMLVNDSFVVNTVCLSAFGLSLVWQLVQWIIIHRQRKQHLEAWNYKA